MRAAIYCRVSTASQEEGTSLETQEASGRNFARERGWTVTDVYREIFTGAELFDRPQLGKLRKAIRRREVDVVIAHALDRLTRNQAHLGVILSEADYAGVGIELVTERLEDTPEGRLLQSVRGFVAEVERLKIAERTVRGRRARAEAGKLLPGKAAPYGYRWRDANRAALDIDPINGPLVQRIFQEVFQGQTIRGIAHRLTAEGIPTPTGGDRWSPSTLHTLLKRRAYTGEAVAWRYGSEKIKGGGLRILVRPEVEHIALPAGTIPPLIVPAVFDGVQRLLVRNREQAVRNNQNPEATLLRGGYARCGTCGTALCASTRKSGDFYRHSSRARDRYGCPPVSMSAGRLDSDVWGRVCAFLTQPDVIAAELARANEKDSTVADLAAIDHRLEAIERKQSNLVRRLALIDDEDTAALVAVELTALASQRRQLEIERAEIEASSTDRQLARNLLQGLEAWCRRVSANLNALTYTEKRAVLDALGIQVRLFHTDQDRRYEITASLPLDGRDGDIVSTASNAYAVLRQIGEDRITLPPDQLAIAATLQPLVERDAARLPLPRLVTEVRAAIAAGDAAMMYLFARALPERVATRPAGEERDEDQRARSELNRLQLQIMERLRDPTFDPIRTETDRVLDRAGSLSAAASTGRRRLAGPATTLDGQAW